MKIDWWTLGLQTINVLVLVWLLGRFLFRPVAAMVAERRAAIARSLAEARSVRDAAEAERDEAKAATAGLAAARNAALKAAADEAEAQKAAILATARAEADKQRRAAEAEIARARQRDADAASDRAGRLALDIAAKLLARLPEEALVSGFVDGLADGLAALPEASRAIIGADGAPVRLTAARALTADETRRCRSRLAEALGRPVEIAVAVDPSLIAGLEIETPHAIVRNSFRADLGRVAAALASADGEAKP